MTPSNPASPPSEPHRTGRPRSRRAQEAVLRSARELLDRHGFSALSMDAIAAHAGASKATIYRWWPSKAAVVMDAYLQHINPQITYPDTGSIRDNLRHQLRALNDTLAGRTLATLVAESQHDPALAQSLRERFIDVRRADAVAALDRARERDQLRAGVDPEIILDMLYGALYYRLLVTGQHTDADYADALVDHLDAVLTPPSSTSASTA